MTQWYSKDLGIITFTLPSSSSVNSGYFRTEGAVDVTLQISFTAGVTGTFVLQTSQDTSNWADIEDSTKSVISTDTVKSYGITHRPSIKYMRIKYTASSGTSLCLVRCDVVGVL